MARETDCAGQIECRVANLSAPLPELFKHVDAAASYLVLNDALDYGGFAAALAGVLMPGGRLVLT